MENRNVTVGKNALEKVSLEGLKARFPQWWEETASELLAVLGEKRIGPVADYLARLNATEAACFESVQRGKIQRSSALKDLVKCRMARLAMEHILSGAIIGKDAGPMRLNWWNGWILQKLLFKRDLQRKPVSYWTFRSLWPFLSQRRFLMPLVQTKGIYCFFSNRLIQRLAAMIGSRPALEIAAGDGTLTHFLKQKGVRIRAMDNYSWAHAIHYPSDVEKTSVSPALARYQPRVVICSWPPANNNFERAVFAATSVEQYIVIGSRHSFASGNWREYNAQTNFFWSCDEKLSKYVLPPDLDPAVYVFQSKKTTG